MKKQTTPKPKKSAKAASPAKPVELAKPRAGVKAGKSVSLQQGPENEPVFDW